MESRATEFTNAQLELLGLFSTNLEENELKELKRILVMFLVEKVDKEMNSLFEQKGWGPDIINEWTKDKNRTPYKVR